MVFDPSTLPRPSERNVTIRVAKRAERPLKRGHPWLWAGAIERESHAGGPGDLAVVYDSRRDALGLGLYDPDSNIRVKMLHRGKPTPIDAAFFAHRLRGALHRRLPLLETGTDGYRAVHGENDGLPGLVVDRYAGTWVLKLYTTAWATRLAEIVPALLELAEPERLVLRLSRGVREEVARRTGLDDGSVLHGPPVDEPVVFRENHLRFSADPIRGQKTGFFLDQRDNRARVGELAQGRSVLNVFAYSGGFSLYAARGGATRVASLDISQPALDAAAQNFALNQDDARVAACSHELLCGDAFELLATLAQEPPFDVVVIDPPSFATREEHLGRALNAYARLVRLGLGVLRPDGHLVLASCSSRVTAEAFRKNARAAAEAAGRPLRIQEETAHALDHPIGFPEGAYLKCLFTRA